jgi:hypothetical protein
MRLEVHDDAVLVRVPDGEVAHLPLWDDLLPS